MSRTFDVRRRHASYVEEHGESPLTGIRECSVRVDRFTMPDGPLQRRTLLHRRESSGRISVEAHLMDIQQE